MYAVVVGIWSMIPPLNALPCTPRKLRTPRDYTHILTSEVISSFSKSQYSDWHFKRMDDFVNKMDSHNAVHLEVSLPRFSTAFSKAAAQRQNIFQGGQLVPWKTTHSSEPTVGRDVFVILFSASYIVLLYCLFVVPCCLFICVLVCVGWLVGLFGGFLLICLLV